MKTIPKVERIAALEDQIGVAFSGQFSHERRTDQAAMPGHKDPAALLNYTARHRNRFSSFPPASRAARSMRASSRS